MENRIACSPDDTEMFTISKYGVWGISQDITSKDAEIACRGMLLYKVLGGNGK